MDTVARTTDNPLRVLRQSRGLRLNDFATLLGIGYGSLSLTELGGLRDLPPALREGLRAIGEDPEAISAAYREWREQKRRELLAQQMALVGG